MRNFAGCLISEYWASFGHSPRVFSASLHASYLQFFLREVNVIKQSVLILWVQSKFLIQILNALVHSLSNLGPGLFPLERAPRGPHLYGSCLCSLKRVRSGLDPQPPLPFDVLLAGGP
jgi:hypothetical protein